MTVSFVIPCYQEEDALAALRPYLAQIDAQEIVFVDDGSTDRTAAALADIAEHDARVRIETHERNRGVGAAQRTGMRAATGDVIVVYDADRTYPLEDAAKLIAALEGDVAIATATPFAGGGGLEDVPAGRSFLSKAAVWCYRRVLGRRARGISVFTCAFRAYRGELARTLEWRSDGFPAAGEILGRALLAGVRVAEVPSTLRRRTEGQSKMRVVRTSLGHLGVLWRLLIARLFG
ncbi:MAG: glycosyltransferase family 2 protein [Planctomycetota bacterium]|nr:glycosyltransferase family 2 protein [Planctomycetota bacterium]